MATAVDTNSPLTSFGTLKQNTATDTKKTDTTKTADETKTGTALNGLNDNFDQFLRLLTTQMQNQDPLKPMDTNEMTQQLVQFANVEQNIATNQRLDKLVKLQEGTSLSSNLFYLNRAVEYEGDSFAYTSGMEKIDLGYQLDKNAKSVRVDILDSQGRLIRSVPGDTTTGEKHAYSWDFKDDQGRAVQPGTYKINVAPTAKTTDETIKATTYTVGVVSGVDYSKEGEPVLKVNGTTVPVAKVTSVY